MYLFDKLIISRRLVVSEVSRMMSGVTTRISALQLRRLWKERHATAASVPRRRCEAGQGSEGMVRHSEATRVDERGYKTEEEEDDGQEKGGGSQRLV